MGVQLDKLPIEDKKHINKVELSHSIHGQKFDEKILFIVSNAFKQNNKKILKEFKSFCHFISFDKLKKNFNEYSSKRELLKQYDHFFCERSISPLMAPLIGKKFFEKNKFPYPVDLGDLNIVDKESI